MTLFYEGIKLMKIQERFNFYYSLLLDEEKRIYIEIVSALRKFNKIVKINMIHKDIDFHAIICAIKEDNPELFYVNFSAVTITMSNFCATVYFAFFYNDVDIYWIMKELSSVVATISLSGNILQDEFNIHKYIANNVEYDYSGSSFDSFTIKGALIDRKAVCEGYSKAFKFLCDFAKIPCLIISGTAKNDNGMVQNHAWNIVNINGDYYHEHLLSIKIKSNVFEDSFKLDEISEGNIDYIEMLHTFYNPFKKNLEARDIISSL